MITSSLRKYFDEIIVLEVDKRSYNLPEVLKQQVEGYDPPWLQVQVEDTPDIFVCGDGKICHESYYDHIDIDPPQNWRGTRQSYNYYLCLWKIIEKAKAANLKNFLFLEDDAWFQPNFDDIFSAAMGEFDLSHEPWDMFYLAGNHHESVTRLHSPHILKCSCTLDMHAVAINHTMYDDILSLRDKDWLHENPYADVTIAHAFHADRHVYCLHPSVVYQYEGFSYNEGKRLSRITNWQHPGRLVG